MSHTSDNNYARLGRSAETRELLAYGDHRAFCLLSLIAIRARVSKEGFNPLGLEPSEAVIGDHKSLGMSREEYRQALKRLNQYGLVKTTKTTTKGTVVKLTCPEVYGVEPIENNHQDNQRATIEQPSSNHQTTIKQPLTILGNREIDQTGNCECVNARTHDGFANWKEGKFRAEVLNVNEQHGILTEQQASEFTTYFLQQTPDGKHLFQTLAAWDTKARLEKWLKTERTPRETEAERHAKLTALGEKWAKGEL